MKSSLKNIGVFLFLIFLIIILPLSYSLYDLQVKLSRSLDIDISLIKENTDIPIMKLLGFFIIELFIGGLGVFFVFKEKMSKNMLDIDELLETEELSLNQVTSEDKQVDENLAPANYSELVEELKDIKESSDWREYCAVAIKLISKKLEVSQGLFFITLKDEIEGDVLEVVAGYAYYKEGEGTLRYRFGEGLAGQAAKAKKIINIKNVPEGYIQIVSGLGGATPNSLLIVPLVYKGSTVGVIELAAFKQFDKELEELMKEIIELITDNLMVLMDKDQIME